MWPGQIAATRPDHPAVIMAGSGQVITYRELDEASNRLAHLLTAAGLGFGDHVAILLENHPRYLEVLWGCHRAGIVYTAISAQLTADEVQYLIEDCGAVALITSRAKADVATALIDRMPKVTTRLMLDGAVDGYDPYEEAVAAFPVTPITEELEGAAMLYSSGTTGRPKGIRYHLERRALGSAPFTIDLFKGFYGTSTPRPRWPPSRPTA
jgi:long-chain acyl-CoA synthetase